MVVQNHRRAYPQLRTMDLTSKRFNNYKKLETINEETEQELDNNNDFAEKEDNESDLETVEWIESDSDSDDSDF